MNQAADLVALILGYLVLGSVGIVLLTLVVGLALSWQTTTPAPSERMPVRTVRWTPEGSPHPLHHDTLWVDAATPDEAWATIARLP